MSNEKKPTSPKPEYKFSGVLPPALDLLRRQRKWVVWDYIWKPKAGKWTKPPLSYRTGYQAAHTNPRNRTSYDEAVEAAQRLSLAGIGFSLDAADGLVGMDLDHCYDPETGKFSALASDVLALAETYAEFSPSGRGLRLFALGTIEKQSVDNDLEIEVYSTGRYLTVTGSHIPGTPDEIRSAHSTIERLVGLVEAAKESDKAKSRRKEPKAENLPTGKNPKNRRLGSAGRPAGGDDFFQRVNALALERLAEWVPKMYPKARQYPNGAWRVTSDEMGRDFEEDLSLHPTEGIYDFGPDRPGSACDVVMWSGLANDLKHAAEWLCEMLDVDPHSLGYRAGARSLPPDPEAPPEGRPEPRRTDGIVADLAKSAGAAPADLPPADMRPVIKIRAGLHHEATDRAQDILVAAGPGPIYQRKGTLVNIGEAPARRWDGTIEQQSAVVLSTPTFLRRVLSQRAACEKWQAREKEWRPCDPPKDLAEEFFSLDSWRLPIMRRLVKAPLIRPDGSLLSEPGFDQSTGLYLCSGLPGVRVPSCPTREDAERASDELVKIFKDADGDAYPWADPPGRPGQSLSVALSGILTAIQRAVLPYAPLHAITAPRRGTGKSHLVDVISLIASGERADCLSVAEKPEEFDKALGAKLIESAALVSLDNLERPLKGGFLNQVLSQTVVSVRVLGLSKTVKVEPSVALFATGNNLEIRGDTVRRTVMCKMDAKMEFPENRVFEADLRDEVLRRRAELVSHALTIIAWRHTWPGDTPHPGVPLAVIQPDDTLVEPLPLAGYSEWCRMVRDPLVALGHADPVQSIQEARATDSDDEALNALLNAWHRAFGDEVRSTRQAIDCFQMIESDGSDASERKNDLHQAMRAITQDKKDADINGNTLGKYIGRKDGNSCDNKCFVLSSTIRGIRHWKVVPPEKS
jgi:putative DNA primase/helicase